MAIAVDASTPAVVEGVSGSGTTLASSAFSPPAGSLIVVFAMYGSNGLSVSSITDSLTTHLTYTKLIASATTNACAEVWVADAPATAPGSMTVTPTWSASGTQTSFAVGVLVLTGAATRASQTGHTASGTGTTGAPSAALTAAAASSWIFAAVVVKVGTAPTIPTGQTDVFNGITEAVINTSVGKGFWIQGNSAPGNSNLTINDTAPTGIWRIAVAEILAGAAPAAGTPARPMVVSQAVQRMAVR